MNSFWSDGEAHWADKDGVQLFLWRLPPAAGVAPAGVIVWVHGSSVASQPTFDLRVPGREDTSAMAWFAARGFDCWTFDSEGYGRSDKHRPINADLAHGVADLAAVVAHVCRVTAVPRVLVYGISSGALKAAMFATAHPDTVARLALEAFVWTGAGSPTLMERRKNLPQWLGSLRRPMARGDVQRIFTRDREGLVDDALIDRFADAVLSLDDSVPNGTYVDMCTKLPVVDPVALQVPTLVLRGEYDGIASSADVVAFFDKLPHMDKQLSFLRGVGHGSLQGRNWRVACHILLGFFSQPEALEGA